MHFVVSFVFFVKTELLMARILELLTIFGVLVAVLGLCAPKVLPPEIARSPLALNENV